MKFVCSLALAFLGLMAGGAQAQDAMGRVRGVYVEAARGVLVERSTPRPGAARWADVELDSSVAPERRRVLVQMPPEMQAKIGDLVGVELATRRAEAIPMQRLSRITEVRSSALAGLEPAA